MIRCPEMCAWLADRRDTGERASHITRRRIVRRSLLLDPTTETDQPLAGVRTPPLHTLRAANRTLIRQTARGMERSALLKKARSRGCHCWSLRRKNYGP